MIIRHATTDDLDSVTLIETSSFNEKEAAKKEEIEERISLDGSYFWLLDDNGEIIAFVQGFPTEEENLTDDMFHTAQKFNTNGGWLMLLSVAAHPLHRGKGFASMVMRRVISDSREQCRKGIVLTCKEQLILFYQKFGFQNEGKSGSEHGGAIWYQMRLTF